MQSLVIAVINSQYSLEFKEDFGPEDYYQLEQVMPVSLQGDSSSLRFVDRIEMSLPFSTDQMKLKAEVLSIKNLTEVVIEALDELEMTHSSLGDESVQCNGIVASINDSLAAGRPIVTLTADPTVVNETVLLYRTLCDALYESEPEYGWFRAHLYEGTPTVTTDYKVSVRLSRVGIPIVKNFARLFAYKDVMFGVDEERLKPGQEPVFPTRIPKKVSVRVVFPFGKKDAIPLAQIVSLLHEAGVILESAI